MKTKQLIPFNPVVNLGFFFIAVLLIFSGCRKDIDITKSAPSNTDLKSMSEMKVAANFNWKTFQDVDVQLKGEYKGVVIIKSASGLIYEKALLQPNETYHTVIAVPACHNELIITYNGQSHNVKIIDKKVSCSY